MTVPDTAQAHAAAAPLEDRERVRLLLKTLSLLLRHPVIAAEQSWAPLCFILLSG
jgi:hypothetical protein